MTAYLTVDTYGTRWFCDEHWEIMGILFNLAIPKCIKKNGCVRNHNVEIDAKEFTITTVKFCGKFYDLCDKHHVIYEEMVGVNGLFYFD